MDSVVVYETMWGNTRLIAEAIADALGTSSVYPVHLAATEIADADLLVVGGPTHARGLTSALTRRMAVQAASESSRPLDSEPARGPGLRRWLSELPAVERGHALAFDTRRERTPWLAGSAGRGIARRLERRGYDVDGTASFVVEATDGPLKPGELERAQAWAAMLGAQVARALARSGPS